jgi:hypothetical protein
MVYRDKEDIKYSFISVFMISVFLSCLCNLFLKRSFIFARLLLYYYIE